METEAKQGERPAYQRGLQVGGIDPKATAMVLDPETGFLESPRHDGIRGSIKARILDNYRITGNLTEACRVNGVRPGLIRWHFANDPAFKAALDECREEISDKAEGHIVQWMSEQKNVIDRLAWLRAHRPERWNPKAEVSVTHNVDLTRKLAAKAREALDTTATQIPPAGG